MQIVCMTIYNGRSEKGSVIKSDRTNNRSEKQVNQDFSRLNRGTAFLLALEVVVLFVCVEYSSEHLARLLVGKSSLLFSLRSLSILQHPFGQND